jgi:hypothetical protein
MRDYDDWHSIAELSQQGHHLVHEFWVEVGRWLVRYD